MYIRTYIASNLCMSAFAQQCQLVILRTSLWKLLNLVCTKSTSFCDQSYKRLCSSCTGMYKYNKKFVYCCHKRLLLRCCLCTSIKDVKVRLTISVTTIFQQSRSKLHSSLSRLTFVSKASEEPIVTATCCSQLSDSWSSGIRPTSWHGWTRRRTSANSESKQQKQLHVIKHAHHASPTSHIGPFSS